MKTNWQAPRPKSGEVSAYLETFKPKTNSKEHHKMANPTQREMSPITGDFITFKDDWQMVEGIFQGSTFIEIKERAVPKYFLLQDDGAQISFLGTVRLVEALARVPQGAYIQITYTGMVSGIKEFSVLVEKGTTLLEPSFAHYPNGSPAVDGSTGEIFGA